MQGTIKIRIGASADRSIESVFGSIEARAKKAGQVVQRAMVAGSGRGGPYRSAAVPANDVYNRQAKAAEDSAKRQTRAVSESTKEQIRFFRQLGRVAEQEMNRKARATRRASEEEQRDRRRAAERFARRTSHRATRFLFPPPSGILGSARRFGTDMLRGAGIDFNFGGMVGRNVALEKSAIALSNQGYDPRASGAAAKRVSVAELTGEARAIGSTYGMDPAKILEAQEAFVSLTGDLDTARKSMADMAKLSAATGSDITEMASAQASVAMALGDTENKSAKVAAIMRTIAGQGKIGAVEIKQLATGMAGLASQAPMFAGDVGQNIEKLGALAQLARATGGAKSAAQAVTGVERFVGTFQTPARVKQFKKLGISVYDKDNKIRDPFELIKESLVATKGDPLKMQKLFMSVMGQRGVRALTSAYTGAGGGQAGLLAVQGQFDKFTKGAALPQSLVDENAKLASESDAAKAQRFQNRLDEIAQRMQTNLLPAMERLAPAAIKVAETFAKIIEWATKNPGEAIVAAIVAAIGRAGLESAARGALEKAILGGIGRGLPVPGGVPVAPGGAGAPGVPPVAGAPGLGLVGGVAGAAALVGVGAAAHQGNALLGEVGSKRSLLDALLPGFENGSFVGFKDPTKFFTGQLSAVGDIAGDVTRGIIDPTGKSRPMLRKGASLAAGMSSDALVAQKLIDPTAIGRGVADAIAGRELRVRVTNPGDIKLNGGGPEVDPKGRSPGPGRK